ncbi:MULTISPECIES: sigma-70 family RNA polymerase sigma factor [unclassified Lysobacter]|uniref:RNA polymerase sigma factor n=1 Tax=unclassified Lysobacter TaxID=2635362 RepID=UPI001BE88253|nr:MULTISPECIES: sigma-70 family RNA polymerase sigma factor [unclassified Lysobacter]MBT2748951.1 sigma-70 family RNA polymerase sigma factor [Lysobacter sp. ISL-42]MBT2751312.1 sigma-70 family RNA polymerase sigma factor [Lysobacter sp. ISL-50]MBT2776516.1 sigma-70 family RNA polymerase sigma factor [Lysobacter sp. ISL-54]MBT2781011.1 sigma-70 family RNA polymerase sigma factor [Lysobacter sp. ISL-52]
MNAEALDSLIGHDLPAAARGDTAAYSRIVGACQNSVTAIALAMVRDVHASEDIAQEAFLNAWQNIRKLQNPSSFLPWLRQITRNLARDHLRARQRLPRGVDDMEAAIASAADPQPSAIERLIEGERAHVAAKLISALPDESREVLLLYYREGQSSQQVAALLGLSDAAVRKRLSRARNSVREELMDRFAAFATASAPTVGFTTMVASALGVIAPSGTTAAILGAGSLGSGLASKLGAGGMGAAGASGGVLGGILVFFAERVLSPVSQAIGGEPIDGAALSARIHLLSQYTGVYGLSGVIGGIVGGAVTMMLMSRYLMSYAGNDEERRAIRRMIRMVSISGALMAASILVSLEASRGWMLPVACTAFTVAVTTWQWLAYIPRVLAPSIERIRRSHGYDPRDSCAYRWLVGPRALAYSVLILVAAMAFILCREGRFG